MTADQKVGKSAMACLNFSQLNVNLVPCESVPSLAAHGGFEDEPNKEQDSNHDGDQVDRNKQRADQEY